MTTMTEQEAVRVLRAALEGMRANFGNAAWLHNAPQSQKAAYNACQVALATTATIQPVAEPEPPQQEHVMPPFAAPAGQHDADERAFDALHGAVMNLPCKPGRAIAMNGASKQAYQEGHRDARHAAADLISVAASGFREERNTSPESNLAAPAQAAPDAVRDTIWPVEPTPEMQQAGASAIRFDTTVLNKLWTANAVYRAVREVALRTTSTDSEKGGAACA